MNASLDDLSVSTPAANDRVHDSYKTIIGLAPGVTSSLVTIAYYKSTPPPSGLFFTEADGELTALASGFEVRMCEEERKTKCCKFHGDPLRSSPTPS